jgi:hypothetical protein
MLLRAVRGVNRRRSRAWPAVLVLLALDGVIAGCRHGAGSSPPLDLSWTLRPQPPIVGPATLTITLHGASGVAMTGARVRLEALMSHPGMAPVRADAIDRGKGVYDTSFAFTMQGDWILLVSIAMPDGTHVERRIEVANVQRPR